MIREVNLRTAVARGLAESETRVDRKNNVIYGAAIIQKGKLNEGDPRPWVNDDETLQQAIKFGNAPNRGLKARFTHPNMSDDGMGKYLGRWKNFRREGDVVRADLHIAESAFSTPHGNLAEYVMDLAEEDPEAFGVSVAPKDIDPEMRKQHDQGDQDIPVRWTGLSAADVVDEPAGTKGGFFSTDSSFSSPAALPYAVTWVLNTHFANVPRAEIEKRLASFFDKHFGVEQTSRSQQMIDSLRQKCIAAGMDSTLSDEDAQSWLEQNGQSVFAAPVAPKEVEAISEIALAEKERCQSIVAICNKFQHPELAQGYIDRDLSVVDVKGELLSVIAKDNRELPDDPEEDPKPLDENQAFRDEYRQAKKSYPSRVKMTEDEWVAMRRIDTGKEQLIPSAN